MKHPKSQLLSDYLDGEISSGEGLELEAHLEECGTCSGLLRELKEIQNQARSLPDQVPERDLWPEISQAIREVPSEDPQVIELHPWAARRPPQSGKPGFRLSYGQALAAGLALAMFSGILGAAVSARPQHSVPEVASAPAPWIELVRTASPGLAEVAGEVAQLEELISQHRDRLDPATARILEKNLGVIDQAIRESVMALRSDPENVFLEAHLARSVQAKGEYLRDAATFVVPVS